MVFFLHRLSREITNKLRDLFGLEVFRWEKAKVLIGDVSMLFRAIEILSSVFQLGQINMVNSVRCIDCFWFGFFRVEQARGGGTTYFHPETLTAEARKTLLMGVAHDFKALITKLLARDQRVACLSEVIDSSGQRHPVERCYDNINASDEFQEIRQIASTMRQCTDFNMYDRLLSFNDVIVLRQKIHTDELASAIEQRKHIHSNLQMWAAFQEIESDSALTPQARGKKFERWLGDVFEQNYLRHTLDVVNSWEQIDFTVWVNDIFCIGEARWLRKSVDCKQVRDFHGKLMDRPPFVIGILVSISGFTSEALNWISKQTSSRTIITADRDSVAEIVSHSNSFKEFVINQLDARLNHP